MTKLITGWLDIPTFHSQTPLRWIGIIEVHYLPVDSRGIAQPAQDQRVREADVVNSEQTSQANGDGKANLNTDENDTKEGSNPA